MKKLFGRDKPKPAKSPAAGVAKDLASPGGTGQENSHFFGHQHPQHDRNSIRVSSDDHWDIISSHDGNSPLLAGHNSPRAVSPFGGPPAVPPAVPPKPVPTTTKSLDRDGTQKLLKKQPPPSNQNGPAAIGILKALDPHPDAPQLRVENSDEQLGGSDHVSSRDDKKERKGFWERASERTREREREKERHRERERKEEEGQAELTRMIGYLTATASEDWSLVLEVCERASASETHAKEAMKALRKEFKYAEAPAQLSAARLWAIMLRNCREVFVLQCASRKFLDTLEDVLQASKTSPVVRERLLEVLAGAAYMSPSGKGHEKEGFRGLWRKVKAPEQPEEGIPFDTEDAMFNPPVPSFHEPPLTAKPADVPRRPSVAKHKNPSRHRVIPPEEDMRRLLQECKVGSGNASLLSEALAFAKPEDLKNKEIIREFYARCRASQELIFAQIPWASAGAERSRQAAGRGSPQLQKRTRSQDQPTGPVVVRQDSSEPVQATQEELLLAEILKANEELTDALRQYDDLERVGIERDTEERSKKETRIDRSQLYYDADGQMHLEPPQPHFAATSSHTPSPSSSPSPSPAPSVMVHSAHSHGGHPLPPVPPHASALSHSPGSFHAHLTPSLAPPPPAPHGPRQPLHSSARSRTPSPDRSSMTHSTQQYHEQYYHDAAAEIPAAVSRMRISDSDSASPESDEEPRVPTRPSAKALGKRRAPPPPDNDGFDPDDLFYEHGNESHRSDEFAEENDEEHPSPQLPWHHPVQYVYDAAAERHRELFQEGGLNGTAPGVVH
ncbi:hypothetical protein PsYK624_156190 [Phanerochaete sordida]|uniref:VHS domain-containing protein n=1 Tax=Phanerochaete sordida TaxID=48140 RepID=A0A9P3GPL0_9APHY|nr:hypothetical protein PsYK624_156190 [Phanerochaete sordida]